MSKLSHPIFKLSTTLILAIFIFRCPKNFRLGMLEFGVPELDNSTYEWRMLQAYDTFTRECPHRVIRSAHGLEPDENVAATITRSDLILLIATVMSRMAMLNLIENELYPVSFVVLPQL